MGLDMYAYSSSKAGARDEYWENGEFKDGEFVSKVTKPKELAYWRKHPNLHGWMEQLWNDKGRPGLAANCEDADVMFNGIELELVEEDLAKLEVAVNEGTLPGTTGFFFGDNADGYYKENDLKFIAHARADLFCGQRVFYNSSW